MWVVGMEECHHNTQAETENIICFLYQMDGTKTSQGIGQRGGDLGDLSP
jgi:hypothetical protein